MRIIVNGTTLAFDTIDFFSKKRSCLLTKQLLFIFIYHRRHGSILLLAYDECDANKSNNRNTAYNRAASALGLLFLGSNGSFCCFRCIRCVGRLSGVGGLCCFGSLCFLGCLGYIGSVRNSELIAVEIAHDTLYINLITCRNSAKLGARIDIDGITRCIGNCSISSGIDSTDRYALEENGSGFEVAGALISLNSRDGGYW